MIKSGGQGDDRRRFKRQATIVCSPTFDGSELSPSSNNHHARWYLCHFGKRRWPRTIWGDRDAEMRPQISQG
ncbi:hypothetical protein U1Q18_031155 [Sarracenia purpurea var. burkii]